MLDARTLEILAAVKTAAVCIPDLRQLLEAVGVEVQATNINVIEVSQ